MESEKVFSKNLKEARRVQDNSAELSRIAENLNISFKNLIDTYITLNDWDKFFELIDIIQEFRRSLEPEKIEKLKIDEIYQYIGDVFYQVDFAQSALEFYKNSIELSKRKNLISIESFENLINNTIDRWHYRMINDRVRNLAYSTAIFKKISKIRKNYPTKTINILDIGSGTGLLSAMCISNAVNFGLDNINLFVCEQNEFFYKISEIFLKSISKNLQKINIKFLKKHSNDIKICDDLSGNKIDIIITEIFDDGLLGEGCISSFYHALCENKLCEDADTSDFSNSHYSRMVPYSAKVYISAIQSDYLRSSNKFSFKTNLANITAHCLDNSYNFEAYYDSDINFEPYSSENLNKIPFEYLTNPIEVTELAFEFGDKKFLDKKFKQNDENSIKKKLKVVQDGTVDAYALWFDLNIDEEITITNSPVNNSFKPKNSQNSLCWHQAIYGISQDGKVSEGQMLEIDLKFRHDCILIFDKVNKRNLSKKDEIQLELGRIDIALLNNNFYQNFYVEWFEKTLVHAIEQRLDVKIGCLVNQFSVFLFKIIFEYKQRLIEKNINLKVELFINKANGDEYLIKIIEKYFLQDGVHLSFIQDILDGDKTYDIDYLIYEPIDVKYGILRKNLSYDLLIIRDRSLNKNLKFFPSGIKLKAMCIESRNFQIESELVTNTNLCLNRIDGVEPNLKKFLSDYNIEHQYSLNPNVNISDFKQLSKIMELGQVDMNANLDNLSMNINNQDFNFIINEAGYLNGLLYWYELVMSDSKFYSPYQSCLTEKDNCSNIVAGIKFFYQDENEANRAKCEKNDHLKIDYIVKRDIFHITKYDFYKQI